MSPGLLCVGQGLPGSGPWALAHLRIRVGEAGSEGTGPTRTEWKQKRESAQACIQRQHCRRHALDHGRRAATEEKEFQTIRERHVDALCAAPRSPGHRPERPEPQKHGRHPCKDFGQAS